MRTPQTLSSWCGFLIRAMQRGVMTDELIKTKNFDELSENYTNFDVELERIKGILVERDYSYSDLLVFAAQMVLSSNFYEDGYEGILEISNKQNEVINLLSKRINELPFGNEKDFLDFIELIKEVSRVEGILSERKSRPKYLAYRRLAKDPKQLALKEIAVHYETKKEQFKRRGYSAQFIREMHQKYPEITDIKTIERLVTKLNKSNELIPPKLVKKVFT